MPKQILICSTIIGTIEAFLIPHIELLKDLGYEVDIAANCDDYIGNVKLDSLVRNRYEIPFQRSPFSISNIKAARDLKKIAVKNEYDIVHFHTPVASAFGRFYLKSLHKNGLKIFYTAHGFHFYKGAPLKNWLIYYPMEKYLSKHTDVLITINQEDYNRANKKFKQKKLYKVPGIGIDVSKFENIEIDKVKKRKELGLNEESFVILSVGELNKNKNHKVIIQALSEIDNSKIEYLISGSGPEHDNLKHLSKTLGLEDRVHLLGMRQDIPEILKVSDIFAFPSKREGLPVSVMEAMASGLPVIVSDIRGCKDLVNAGENGAIIDNSVSEWKREIIIMERNQRETKLHKYFNTSIVKLYQINEVLKQYKELYDS